MRTSCSCCLPQLFPSYPVKQQRLILLSASQDKKWCGFFCICEDLYEVFLNYIYCFGQDFHKLRS